MDKGISIQNVAKNCDGIGDGFFLVVDLSSVRELVVTAKICMALLQDRVIVLFGLLRFIVVISGQHLPPLETCLVPSGSIKASLQRGTFRPSPSLRELRKPQKESL